MVAREAEAVHFLLLPARRGFRLRVFQAEQVGPERAQVVQILVAVEKKFCRSRKRTAGSFLCPDHPDQARDAPMDSALATRSALFRAEFLSFKEPQWLMNSVEDAPITAVNIFSHSVR